MRDPTITNATLRPLQAQSQGQEQSQPSCIAIFWNNFTIRSHEYSRQAEADNR